jgi:hypothetical protein
MSLSGTFRGERGSVEAQVAQANPVSTEELRVALRRYRSLLHRLLSLVASHAAQSYGSSGARMIMAWRKGAMLSKTTPPRNGLSRRALLQSGGRRGQRHGRGSGNRSTSGESLDVHGKCFTLPGSPGHHRRPLGIEVTLPEVRRGRLFLGEDEMARFARCCETLDARGTLVACDWCLALEGRTLSTERVADRSARTPTSCSPCGAAMASPWPSGRESGL